jgi:hypothetical protein
MAHLFYRSASITPVAIGFVNISVSDGEMRITRTTDRPQRR